MENFNFEGQAFQVIKANQKSITSIPQIKVTSSKNHFSLNSVALELMDCAPEDRVILVRLKTANADRRFFIAKAVEGDESAKLGSQNDGKSCHFNYSGVYGAIYMDEVERSMVSIEELVKAGLFNEYTTPKGKLAATGIKTITFDLESIGEHEVAGAVREMFAFTDRRENVITSEDEVEFEDESQDEAPQTANEVSEY